MNEYSDDSLLLRELSTLRKEGMELREEKSRLKEEKMRLKELEMNEVIIEPTPVSNQPWKNSQWLDENGKCWMGHPGDGNEYIPSWRYCCPEDAPNQIYSLPYWYIPLPKGT
jgi:hypothetical protein